MQPVKFRARYAVTAGMRRSGTIAETACAQAGMAEYRCEICGKGKCHDYPEDESFRGEIPRGNDREERGKEERAREDGGDCCQGREGSCNEIEHGCDYDHREHHVYEFDRREDEPVCEREPDPAHLRGRFSCHEVVWEVFCTDRAVLHAESANGAAPRVPEIPGAPSCGQDEGPVRDDSGNSRAVDHPHEFAGAEGALARGAPDVHSLRIENENVPVLAGE